MNARIKTVIDYVFVPFWASAAFVVFGVLGGVFAGALQIWFLPVAGFMAAAGVVIVSYWVAPDHKLVISVLCGLLGAAVAWEMLAYSSYPESYGEGYAYRQTCIPLICTYVGGGVGLLVCYVRESLRSPV